MYIHLTFNSQKETETSLLYHSSDVPL